MATLHAPAAHSAGSTHDLWRALLATPRHHAGQARTGRPATHRHETPARHLMTDPDVFDVFGEDDAA